MPEIDGNLTTGIPGLDRVLTGLIPGDNIVFQVDGVEHYEPFLTRYAEDALRKGKQLTYFRFAKHSPLIPEDSGAEFHTLRPEAGFEAFVSDIHRTIERTGPGCYYVFDCLSELAVDWYSDQMLGNFFMLTCPYVLDVGAIACFALLRGYHSPEASGPVLDTAQIVLDVYRHGDASYVHPVKVQHRYSPTMHMLHVWREDDLRPVVESATISEIMNSVPWTGLEGTSQRVGVVNRAFGEAERALDETGRSQLSESETEELLSQLLRTSVTREEKVYRVAQKYMTLADLVKIKKRMIGTGRIGGKSTGVLLGRSILEQQDPRWSDLLEPHDSFFVGSDVYYTFVVRNGLWWVRERQKDPATFLEGAERARQRMLGGTFPDYIMKQFAAMLDYYGQSPIVVRSSSLLEDSFGNGFAGKYKSVFCTNQGPGHKRLEEFLSAVRTVYASTMSERALRYRAQKGLLGRDEQMGLLIQRASGGMYGEFFYPHVAGVGLSHNPYVWSADIKPESGVLRLVFGLGTRAVDRYDDDYTRIVALNAPDRRPESSLGEVRRYSQRRVDVLDLRTDQFCSSDFRSVAVNTPELPLEVFASRDSDLERRSRGSGGTAFTWVLTFDKLLKDTDFPSNMREMLRALQDAYDYPVETEFTANFSKDGRYRINLVQCWPLQVRGGEVVASVPELADEDVVFRAHGAVLGHSRVEDIDRIIYVVAKAYSELSLQKRYSVARLIGRLVRLSGGAAPKNVMLMAPGRLGTSTPELGVPIDFSEVNTVRALCEIVAMRDGLVPDVSLGTHFLNDLVEMDVLYLALFPDREGNFLNDVFLETAPNCLADLLPSDTEYSDVVRVIDVAHLDDPSVVKIYANALTQTVIGYMDNRPRKPRPE
jgi:hypothetical protein